MFVSKKRERECLTGMYWYIFYKDQLLLQKQGEGYSVPCMCECPVRVEQTLPVEMPDGTRAMAAYTDEPLEETEAFLPMGLRASYDYLERHFYEQAGKIYADAHKFAVLPLWRADAKSGKQKYEGSLDEACEFIREVAEKNGFIIIDGRPFMPQCPEFFWDGRLHPNDLGFAEYAAGVIAEIEKHI